MVARRRRSVADLINLVAMAGDFVVIFAGLALGFWLRFKSGILPHSTEATWLFVPGSEEVSFDEYLRLIALGAVFLFVTFLSMDPGGRTVTL